MRYIGPVLLKVLAIVVMIVDHIGVIFFPEKILLRLIGRISFPIFSFFIAEGFIKTNNLKKYIVRMLILAIVSQIPYSFALESKGINVIFTFVLALISLMLYRRYDSFAWIIVIGIIAEVMNVDYGAIGIAYTFIFYKSRDMKKVAVYMTLSTIGISLLRSLCMNVAPFEQLYISISQLSCLVSLVFIKYYDPLRKRAPKYLFYYIYPLHFIILKFIDVYYVRHKDLF